MESGAVVAAMRLLVIDDDAVVRELLEALLGLEGHTVTTAETGEAGLAALRAAPDGFDGVLSDLHLPGVDTAQLAAHLEALRGARTVLLAMSATRPDAEVLRHFDGFLLKPFQPGDIAAAVEAARAKAGSGEASHAAPAESRSGMGGPMLDEGIYGKLAATLPAAQLLELYTMTLHDVGQRLERMRSALATGDQAELRREAHAIKGSCGMVGAVELRELASAAEGGSPECTPPLEDFLRASERLRRMLNERLA